MQTIKNDHNVEKKEYVIKINISKNHPYLKDHKVNGFKVLPAVAALKIAYYTAKKITPLRQIDCIEDVSWLSPITCQKEDVKILLFINIEANSTIKYFFKSYLGSLYSCGTIKCSQKSMTTESSFIKDQLISFSRSSSKIIDHTESYDEFDSIGISYGPFFRTIDHVQVQNNYGLAKIQSRLKELEFVNLLDGSFQSGMAISKGSNMPNLMPISLGKLLFHSSHNVDQNSCYSAFTEKFNQFRTNITIFNKKMEPFISIIDLGIRSGNFN